MVVVVVVEGSGSSSRSSSAALLQAPFEAEELHYSGIEARIPCGKFGAPIQQSATIIFRNTSTRV